MADNSYNDYLKSGYYSATNIATLQEQLAQYATDDATLRAQAEAQYKPTYDATRQSYQNQLNELMTGQQQQLREINLSYDKGLSTLNSNLLKRGLGRSSLVATQGVAMENQRAQAIADKTNEYLAQQNSINSQIQLLDASYAQQIEARINELREQNQTAATQLQLQIAELQYNGYLAYMAAKQSRSSGSGSSSRSYSYSSGGGGGSSSSSGGHSSEVIDYDLSGGTLLDKASNAIRDAVNFVGDLVSSGNKPAIKANTSRNSQTAKQQAKDAARSSLLSSGTLRHSSRN